MAELIPVAMIGLGQWGPNLLRNLREGGDFQVAALCDRDAGRLERFAPLHPGARLYSTLEEVAADPVIRAVVLATPAGLHEEQAATLLRAGKDVLVEKPLAMTLDGARNLVLLARALGRVLMTGHTFLFNPAVQRVRSIIDSGRLGRVQFISAQRLSLGQVRQDCNALWNLAPHDISILLHWLDAMPTSVVARGLAFHERHEQEDLVMATLEFPDRRMVSLQVSWLNPVKVRAMTVVGSERMLVYDDVDQEKPLMLYDRGLSEVSAPTTDGSFEHFRLVVRPGPEERIDVEKREPLSLEVAHFAECIRTRTEPTGSGDAALRIISVLEACQRSLRGGGVPVVPEPV
ncbi:gfo/Idh/MocA family oxidoreductase [bacterium]|nr:gfo/Idh/MocA family oxidoreductase [bacterium]